MGRQPVSNLVFGALLAVCAAQAQAQAAGDSPLAAFLKAHPGIEFSHDEIVKVSGRCPTLIETGSIGSHWNRTIDWSRIQSIKIYDNNPFSVVLDGPIAVERTADGSGRGDQTNGTVFTGGTAELKELLKTLQETSDSCGGKPSERG